MLMPLLIVRVPGTIPNPLLAAFTSAEEGEYSGKGTPVNTRESYYMDAVAGRYERVFPVARYADVVDLGDVGSVRASLSGNLWFRSSDDVRWQSMIDKVARLEPAVAS
jgi:hypothetical protein